MEILNLPNRPVISNSYKVSTQQTFQTNYFKIQLQNKGNLIFIYRFDFEPVIEGGNRTEIARAINTFRKEIEQKLQKFIVRGQNLYCWTNGPDSLSFVKDDKLTIRLKKVADVELDNYQARKDQTGTAEVQVLNTIIKQLMKQLDYTEIGKNSKFYNPNKYQYSVEDRDGRPVGLNVWKGFKTSINVCSKELLLLIDFSTRVLQSCTVLDNFRNCRNQEEKISSIQGLSVASNYGNHQIYRVDKVIFDKTVDTITFVQKDGKSVSLREYFKNQYKINIKDGNQPILYSERKQKDGKIQQFYLVPELMMPTGMTDNQRANFQTMAALAKFTKLEPSERDAEIKKLQSDIQSKSHEYNLKIERNVEVEGNVVQIPKLQFQKAFIPPESNYMPHTAGALLKPSFFSDWILIYQSQGKRDDNMADDFVDGLISNSKVFGIQFKDPIFLTTKSNRPDEFIKVLESELKQTPKPQIIVSIIDRKDKNRLYEPLKEFLYHQKGIPHQNAVIQSFTDPKKARGVFTKLALQMNAKLGDPLWTVARPDGIPEKTMLIGIDVYNKLVDKGRKACVGIVASLDRNFSKFHSNVIIEERGAILSNKLAGNVVTAVQQFFKLNKSQFYPDTIIIYRDGVAENQNHMMWAQEIQPLLDRLLQEKITADIAFLTINKKINQRFFASGNNRPQTSSRGRSGKQYQDSLVNPPSGTVISKRITSSKEYEFFMCAQNVTQGTCNPTKLTVLHNTTKLTEEQFWALTYYQTFNYYNWTGAVKVPAPVQYAHKLAFLIGDTFQDNVNEKLASSSIYYL